MANDDYIYEDQDGRPKYLRTHPDGYETTCNVSSTRALHNIDISLRRMADSMEKSADVAPPAAAPDIRPIRNCDLYKNAAEAWEAYEEWAESYRSQGKVAPYNEFGWMYLPACGGPDGK